MEDLQRVAKKFHKDTNSLPETITRNYYRKNSKLAAAAEREFASFSEFRKAAWPNISTDKKEKPKFGRDNIEVIRDDSNKGKKRRYFVTTAVAGQSLHDPFFHSIKTYCEKNKAELVILPMHGVRARHEQYPEELKEYAHHMVSHYTFNSKICAFDIMLKPQDIIPLTGLPRLGQKSNSIIVASPKQQMKVVPVSTNSTPHILQSTGSITCPDSYTYTRRGVLGRQDHVLGGVVIEIPDDGTFLHRQVRIDSLGGFYDLDSYYLKEKQGLGARAEAMVVGDIHAGFVDPTARKAWFELGKTVRTKRIFLHDLMDGCSISHHHENDLMAKVSRPANVATLEAELETVGKELQLWQQHFPDAEIIVVASNHDEHLNRYLKEGRFVKDHANVLLALELGRYYFSGLNPIEEYLKLKMGITGIRWLKRDEDYRVEGIQCGLHGDKGANGGKGGVHSIELSFGRAMVGHAHTPQIFRDTWVVGTTSYLQRDYTIGYASSWLHTSGLIYPGGQRTLITSINGRWRM